MKKIKLALLLGLTIGFGVQIQESLAFDNTYNFGYTGKQETWTVPKSTCYQIEAWGAQGSSGNGIKLKDYGGGGGYTIGIECLKKGDNLYITVGGKGQNRMGGYNGGGDGGISTKAEYHGGGGGGSTDIRLQNPTSWDYDAFLLSVGGGGGASGSPDAVNLGPDSELYSNNRSEGMPANSHSMSYSMSEENYGRAQSGGNGNSSSFTSGLGGKEQSQLGSSAFNRVKEDMIYHPYAGGGGGGGIYSGGGGGGASSLITDSMRGKAGSQGTAGKGGTGGDGGSPVKGVGHKSAGGGGGGAILYKLTFPTDMQKGYPSPTNDDPFTEFNSGHIGNGYVRIKEITPASFSSLFVSPGWTKSATINFSAQKGDYNFNKIMVSSSLSDFRNTDVYYTVPESDRGKSKISGSFNVTSNGTYKLSASINSLGVQTVENAPTWYSTDVVVSNIDNTSPTAELQTSLESDGGVLISFKKLMDSQSGISSVLLPNGTTTTFENPTYKVYEDGIYNFKVFDNVGNERSVSIHVDDTNVSVTEFEGEKWQFGYTGSPQTFIVPKDGLYRLETWGAEGHTNGGKGGYAKGNFALKKGQVIYAYVGQVGQQSDFAWNGGGSSIGSKVENNGGGGGATDFRLNNGNWDSPSSLYSRFIVAGGGGGGMVPSTSMPGYGGGWYGGLNTSASGTQSGSSVLFGKGAITTGHDDYAGGGGGWYGGNSYWNFAGGGSGYVHTSKSYRPSQYTVPISLVAERFKLRPGFKSMPSTDGVGSEIGHSGNGFAKITELKEAEPPRLKIVPSESNWVNKEYYLNIEGIRTDLDIKNITMPDGKITSNLKSSYLVTENGEYLFSISDVNGNVRTERYIVNNIDKKNPMAMIEQSSNDWTNKTVTLKLSNAVDADSGLKHVTLPNGIISPIGASDYIVDKNGDYQFILEDNAGNTQIITKKVNNIDTGTPTITSSVDGSTPSEGLNIILSGEDSMSGVKHILLPDGRKVTGKIASYHVFNPGDYTFTVEDNAGNTKTVTETVLAPKISVHREKLNLIVNVDSHYSDNPLTKRIETGENWNTKKIVIPITKEGNFTFTTNDGGISSSTSYVIDNYENLLKPQIDISYDGFWKNDSVKLLVKVTSASDSEFSIQMPDGTKTSQTEFEYRVSENGIYTFFVRDENGRINFKSVQISNIDKTAPLVEINTTDGWVNENQIIKIEVKNN